MLGVTRKSNLLCSGSLIKPLPDKVKETIRSSINLISAVDCVEELVLNSLDAQASTVTINVDLTNFRIKVDDNGVGIAPEDLKVIGTRYTTSKCSNYSDLQNLNTFGYRGEALASIVQMSSSVEIFTRQEVTVYSRKLREDGCGILMKANLSKKPTKGTTVVVNGFMSKVVVRQKRINPPIELEEIKSRVESIALVHPRVSIILTDDEKSSKILSITSCISTKDVFRQLYGFKCGLGDHVLYETTCQYDVFFFSGFISNKMYTQHSYQHLYINRRLITRGHFNRAISDAIAEFLNNETTNQGKKNGRGRTSEDKKKYPVFFVNIQCPVSEVDMTIEPRKKLVEFKRKKTFEEALESLIRRLKAVLASVRLDEPCSIVEKRPRAEKMCSVELGKSITTHAIKRAVHSRMVQRESNNSKRPKLNQSETEAELDETVHSEHPKSVSHSPFSPASVSVVSEASSQHSQRRISTFKSATRKDSNANNNKVGDESSGSGSETPEMKDHTTITIPENFLFDIVAKELSLTQPRRPSYLEKLKQYVKKVQKLQPILPKPEEDEMSWESLNDGFQLVTDSRGTEWMETFDATSEQFVYTQVITGLTDHGVKMCSRTKLTANQIALLHMNQEKPERAIPRFSFQKEYMGNGPARKSLNKDGKMDLLESGKSIFSNSVKDLIQGTSNMSNTKWRYPNLLENSGIENGGDDFFVSEYWDRTISTSQLPIASLNTSDVCCTKFDKNFVFKKEDLSNIRVIGQLDNKFIIGNMSINRPDLKLNVLVLFDQHAVHERIRLEDRLKELYETGDEENQVSKQKRIATVAVHPPIILHFTETEICVIKSFRNDLEVTGIYINLCGKSTSVNVIGIPKCFADKISNETVSTRDDTVMNITYNLIQEQLKYLLETKQQSTTIPKTIFNLLCSQACHGAIKFGDHLTLEACEELVNGLQKCQVPFQCAHGRPSLIPLCTLEDEEDDDIDDSPADDVSTGIRNENSTNVTTLLKL